MQFQVLKLQKRNTFFKSYNGVGGEQLSRECKRFLKGAMSQGTGLEVPRCWPQYKRMFLVRVMCIDIVSVGLIIDVAIPTVHVPVPAT